MAPKKASLLVRVQSRLLQDRAEDGTQDEPVAKRPKPDELVETGLGRFAIASTHPQKLLALPPCLHFPPLN